MRPNGSKRWKVPNATSALRMLAACVEEYVHLWTLYSTSVAIALRVGLPLDSAATPSRRSKFHLNKTPSSLKYI